MNLYFVLEGEKTEVKLYPKWIEYILPDYSKVDFEHEADQNNYYIFSGGGIPSIYNHVINAIKNINDNPIYDKLIVCLDGEEIGVEARLNEIKTYINNTGVILNGNCEIHFVIQNICIETWFLGNRKIVKKNPQGSKLQAFKKHFNVIDHDPELMDEMEQYRNKAHFHYSYFREVLKERNLTYRKSRPDVVLEKTYLDQLTKRILDTDHIPTFKKLYDLLMSIAE